MTATLQYPAATITNDWLRDLVELIGVRDSDPASALPPLLGHEAPVVVTGRIELHPYLLRGDVTALVRWTLELDGPSLHAYPAPSPGDVDVHVLGILLGQPVRLRATTHRRVPGAPGLLTSDQLGAVVQAEIGAMPSLRRWWS
ncbi:hypothetical protein [Pseudonocardia kongjuensis]|uniref:hypothetical protein n=1 Tax=Pseudonocardia kongjuensis TaxID=102227 RepID=UPI0031D0B442